MNQSKPNKNIQWGIIGLGGIAHKFASDLLNIDDADLYAVGSRTQAKADEFAKTYHAKKAYSSYKALVEDPNIDAVYIATPHALHKENTLLCLNHGKPVLCEKAFGMNAEEVEVMIQTAKAKKLLLMEALWTYFLPHYQFALQEIRNDRYGKLLKLEADFGFFRAFDDTSRLFKKSLGGGSLLDIGIYPIFAALSSLGVPKHIEAQATFFDNGADSSCKMHFKYDSGIQAFLASSLVEDLATEAIFTFEIGSVKINRQFHTPTSVSLTFEDETQTKTFEESSFGYTHEIKHFNTLLRNGKTESDIMTFDFSRKLIGLLDQVREIIDLEY
ncbi:Gfo/Idh/MocA family oxidoreductase [Gaetbulibacter sp. M240]|uniref:Gfo/Idh/MocA family protein n=1 Tax=Gaetbulibacter sp. M240 TaxID=3126511 RepID=UPI00374F7E59